MLADATARSIHLGERDCTLQRRHQKIVEETPSPAVDAELRERIGQIAVDAARAVGYRSAGTIEGLLDRDGNYCFLEMNTRIQVEHTITELVTGIDLVREQILVAAGEPLSVRQEDVAFRGHAIECRINAEDAANGFLPSPGTITALPRAGRAGRARRLGRRGGLARSSASTTRWSPSSASGTRIASARGARMLRALEEFVVEGVHDARPVPPRAPGPPVLRRRGRPARGSSSRPSWPRRRVELASSAPTAARSTNGREQARAVGVEIEGRRFEVTLYEPEPPHAELARRRRERAAGRRQRRRRPRRSSARCRAPCSRSRSPTATRSRRAASSA